jgi:hypothetical protein
MHRGAWSGSRGGPRDRRVGGRRVGAVEEELGDVEADAARADDGDALADGRAPREHVIVRRHLGVVGPLDLQRARRHARRQHHLRQDGDGVNTGVNRGAHRGAGARLVEAAAEEGGRVDARAEARVHARRRQLAAEVADRLVELLLARHLEHSTAHHKGRCACVLCDAML